MIAFENTLDVARPPEVASAALADLTRVPELLLGRAAVEGFPRCRPWFNVSKETATARVVACVCDGGAWTMRVTEVLRRKGGSVVTIAPDRSVRELLALLAEHRIGALVVSDDGVRVDGIISERDVVRRLHTDGASILDGAVSAIMTVEVRTCDPADQLDELMAVMTERRIRHLPVLVDGRLAGIVSIGDVVKHRIAEVQDERDHLTAYITG